MKLAILGGSFNPVHVGHISLANCVVDNFGYERVAFVPAFSPPHKLLANGATNEDRCAMLSLAIAKNPAFQIETCELERKGISYTIDTVKYLYDKYKHCLEGKIGIIIGFDLVKDFHNWKDAKELVQITDVLLAFRNGVEENVSFNFSFNYTAMENTKIDVSSNGIRNKILSTKSWKDDVSKEVYEYIQEKKLYTGNYS